MRGVPCDMTSSCVQSGVPRPVGGFQPNVMMGPSSPVPAWQFHSALPKLEPVDHEDRNDSGINSGSDFYSSSPGSDHSENIPYSSASSSQMTRPTSQTDCYSTPLAKTGKSPSMIYHQQQILSCENRLTPPISEPMASPKEQDQQNVVNLPVEGTSKPIEIEQHSLTSDPVPNEAGPSESPLRRPYLDLYDPLKKLQMALQKNIRLPMPFSSKISECSDETKSDNDVDEYDERELRVPKVNSHGKVKTFKCKQCDFRAITQVDFWNHTRSHIKPDKLLTCPRCPFVTEYKHHLEYHLRNHFGTKPFKCTYCKYTCVNKSMLNSHLKSHSKVCQYRCADCCYETKYCHSFKQHLRKYNHSPAMVLNPDGTPNPLLIVDVYGTRRGPKLKMQETKSPEEPKPEQNLPFPLNQLQLPFPGFPFFPAFPGGFPNPFLLQNLENIAKGQAGLFPPQDQPQSDETSSSSLADTEALDLSKPDETVQKNRRKGHAFKLTPTHDVYDDDEETTMFSNVEVVEDRQQAKEETEEAKPEEGAANNNDEEFNCHYCKITFGDAVLYTMHMGYHGYNNPFTCNMCGEECEDKVSFFVHIARTPHS